MTPVSGTQIWELDTHPGHGSLLEKGRATYPNNRLMVVVKEIAMPEASAVTIVEVPELGDDRSRFHETHQISETTHSLKDSKPCGSYAETLSV